MRPHILPSLCFMLFLCILSFSLNTYVHAEESTTTTSTSSDMVTETTLPTHTEDNTRRAERDAVIKDALRTRVFDLGNNITNRMLSITDRFDNIADRLERRIGKLQAQHIITTDAEQKLAEARQATNDAREILIATKKLLNDFLSSRSPRDTLQAVREQYTIARGDLRAAHASLRQSVALLKQAVRDTTTRTDTTKEATSTQARDTAQ